jgi:hypothetical protein
MHLHGDIFKWWTRGGVVDRGALLQAGRSSIPGEIIEGFQYKETIEQKFGPLVRLASNRNEYQKMFRGNRTRPARKDDSLTAIELNWIEFIYVP